jgi:hypothetical protein
MAGPSQVRAEGRIGVYGRGGVPVIDPAGHVGQYVEVVVEGLHHPVSRLEFSLTLPGVFHFQLVSGAYASGPDFVVQFDECVDVSDPRSVASGQGNWITDPPSEETEVCLGPHGNPSVPATGPMYRACDGTWYSIDLAKHDGWDVEPGCARMGSDVAAQALSWSTVKSRY